MDKRVCVTDLVHGQQKQSNITRTIPLEKSQKNVLDRLHLTILSGAWSGGGGQKVLKKLTCARENKGAT